jgi:glycosyltransferase involved in cell wall biosynthesis
MISVVMATFNDAATLGPTLSALVPAAVDGLVREVILADAGSTDATLDIADDAGARLVMCAGPPGERIARGCAAARGDWLLILETGPVPPAGWQRAVDSHLKSGSGAAYWGGQPRLLRRPKAPSLLIPRRLFDDAGGYSEDLASMLGARKLAIQGR